MQESDTLRLRSDHHERTSDIYTDKLRGRTITPWEQRPSMDSLLSTPLQHLSPDDVKYAQDYAPTAPLQVRIAKARPAEDEALTVAQMSKNLVAQQQGLDVKKSKQAKTSAKSSEKLCEQPASRHRSKSLTRTDTDWELPDTDLQSMRKAQAQMMKTIKMHAEVLADHRDAIRKSNERSEHHEVVMLKHSNSLSKLKSRHEDSSAAHMSLSAEVARIKQNFSAKTGSAVKAAPKDTYTSFQQLQSKYKAV